MRRGGEEERGELGYKKQILAQNMYILHKNFGEGMSYQNLPFYERNSLFTPVSNSILCVTLMLTV